MITLEQQLRQQYVAILAEFTTEFPDVTPPEPAWFQLWLGKYLYSDISAAIRKLGQHPLKASFTQQSTGKALSVMLKQDATRRAFSSDPAVRS
jgi:hypothetical protein